MTVPVPRPRLVWLALAMCCAPGAFADSGPQPPCGGDVVPAYPELDRSPVVKVWDHATLRRDWIPPACTGWTAPGFSTLVVTVARFRYDGGTESMLRAIGAISQLAGIRYWSTTRQRWQTLVVDAFALSGPGSGQRRGDFSMQEMSEERDLYYQQSDNLSGKAAYLLRVRIVSPDHLVFSTENITTLRYYLVPLFRPGEIQSIYFFDRESPGIWRYYNIARTGRDANALAAGHAASSINRAVAFFRHWAGIPTDQEPPAAR